MYFQHFENSLVRYAFYPAYAKLSLVTPYLKRQGSLFFWFTYGVYVSLLYSKINMTRFKHTYVFSYSDMHIQPGLFNLLSHRCCGRSLLSYFPDICTHSLALVNHHPILSELGFPRYDYKQSFLFLLCIFSYYVHFSLLSSLFLGYSIIPFPYLLLQLCHLQMLAFFNI